jgi:hypothetical protein
VKVKNKTEIMKKLTIHLTRITHCSFRPPITYNRRPGRHLAPTPHVATASITHLSLEVGPSGIQTIEFQELTATIENPDLFP